MAGGVFTPLTPKPRGYDAYGNPIYHADDTVGGSGAQIRRQAGAIPVTGLGSGLANFGGSFLGAYMEGEDPNNQKTNFSLGDKAKSWFNLGPDSPTPASPLPPAPPPGSRSCSCDPVHRSERGCVDHEQRHANRA